MNKAVTDNINSDIAIFTAAVSDIAPKKQINKKLKKENLKIINFKINPDIIKNISLKKNKKPKLIIGFAAETDNVINNAKNKLIKKNCDMIVVNKIDKKNMVFGSDYNQVTIIDKNKVDKLKKMTKINVAKILVKNIINSFNK